MWELGVLLLILAVPVAGFGLTIVLFVRFDRRRQWRSGDALTPPYVGACAASAVVDLNLRLEHGDELAVEILRRCGIRPESPRFGIAWSVGYGPIGWRTWSQEYAVAVQPITDASSRIWCCSRPRFSTTLIDWGASRHAVARMQRAIDEITREKALA